MLHRDVADGVHRIEDAAVNWYLVEGDDGLTAVDAGLPRSWGSLQAALRALGRSAGDLRAVVLTHAHFDHVGFARRARSELGVPVLVHEAEAWLAAHPFRYRQERPVFMYGVRHPSSMLVLGRMTLAGAPLTKGVHDATTFTTGVLDVPGRPHVVPTPGHTDGHCALHLPDRDTLIAGDAVVTFNPYTGGRGPQLVARAATADSARAMASLDAIAATGARIVLTGHGPEWTDGAEAAAQQAREAGLT